MRMYSNRGATIGRYLIELSRRMFWSGPLGSPRQDGCQQRRSWSGGIRLSARARGGSHEGTTILQSLGLRRTIPKSAGDPGAPRGRRQVAVNEKKLDVRHARSSHARRLDAECRRRGIHGSSKRVCVGADTSVRRSLHRPPVDGKEGRGEPPLLATVRVPPAYSATPSPSIADTTVVKGILSCGVAIVTPRAL